MIDKQLNKSAYWLETAKLRVSSKIIKAKRTKTAFCKDRYINLAELLTEWHSAFNVVQELHGVNDVINAVNVGIN